MHTLEIKFIDSQAQYIAENSKLHDELHAKEIEILKLEISRIKKELEKNIQEKKKLEEEKRKSEPRRCTGDKESDLAKSYQTLQDDFLKFKRLGLQHEAELECEVKTLRNLLHTEVHSLEREKTRLLNEVEVLYDKLEKEKKLHSKTGEANDNLKTKLSKAEDEILSLKMHAHALSCDKHDIMNASFSAGVPGGCNSV